MLLRDNKLSKALVNGTKTLAVTAALLLTVGIGSSFAAPAENGNDIVIASFHKEFRSANVIKVETKKEYTKVTFNMNDVVMFAYYSENGDLMAVVRNILSTQLPIRLLMDLKQNHAGCWITDLFEIDSNGQTIYYASLENGDMKVTLRSANTNTWETYHKESKETKEASHL
jgi:ABC-type proline/glycine betaine transport system substrate-binding protein